MRICAESNISKQMGKTFEIVNTKQEILLY
jgi:hypothetical protein